MSASRVGTAQIATQGEIRRMSSLCRTETSVRLAWSALASRLPRPSASSTRWSRWAPFAIALLEPLAGGGRGVFG